jgi:diacylglycerol kinase family enzyme
MAPVRHAGITPRLAAIAALGLVALVVALIAVSILDDPWRLAVQLALFFGLMFAAWYALTRPGGRRVIGAVFALAALASMVAIAFTGDGGIRFLPLVWIGLLLLAASLARIALALDVRSLTKLETPGVPMPAAARGVLIMNTRSGGGKAERFQLAEECRRRGIEPVVLDPGDDLSNLARDAVDRGADVIGMAGGDGSQALVAAVAAERGVPMVVVPAGTRNHLALDLGLDRNDVVGTLDAYGDCVEQAIDLAEVNGRVFVNNVSLGLYATIVRSPEYREAKAETTLAALPRMLGPGTAPFDLGFTGPAGEAQRRAHLIQVSNNPYGKGWGGSRPRLDTGRLGVVALEIADDRAATAFLTAMAIRRPQRFAGLRSWTPETFEVTSSSTIDLGIDGESSSLEPPLRFSIRAQALRVRLPKHAIGYSPAARALDGRSAIGGLWDFAIGRRE